MGDLASGGESCSGEVVRAFYGNGLFVCWGGGGVVSKRKIMYV